MSLPANNAASAEPSLIAGSVLPIKRAEELLGTLPGVLSARIVASPTGSVEEIHVLTTPEVTPRQTVRNVEAALIAHLGMRLSERKISVATHSESRVNANAAISANAANPEISVDSANAASAPIPPTATNSHPGISDSPGAHPPDEPRPRADDRQVRPISAASGHVPAHAPKLEALSASPLPPTERPKHSTPGAEQSPSDEEAPVPARGDLTSDGEMASASSPSRRRIYFEDIEVRRSRSKGLACRVTLRKGGTVFVGEAEGMENERFRLEIAARATLEAIKNAESGERLFALEGCKLIEAFDHHFVFVGVTTREGRESCLVTGSAEVRESPETASSLAVLDATNRWLSR